MKKYIMIILFFCTACVNIKTIHTDTTLYPDSYPVKQILEKFDARSEDKSIVVFTGWFENDTIKILNDNKVIFEQPVQTTPQTGFATFWVVSNEKKVEIQVLTSKTVKISLKKSDLKKNKFVYISRDAFKKNNYSLEYSNEWKKFM